MLIWILIVRVSLSASPVHRVGRKLGSFHPVPCSPRRNVAQGLSQERCVWFQGQRFHSLPVGASLSRCDQQQKCSFPISNHDIPCLQLVLIASCSPHLQEQSESVFSITSHKTNTHSNEILPLTFLF